MKKMMRRLTALALCLAMLAGSALAVDQSFGSAVEANLTEEERQKAVYPMNLAAVGDTLYILAEYQYTSGTALLRWREGQDALETVIDRVVSGNYYNTMEEAESSLGTELMPEGTDVAHLFGPIFSDGERLMSLNPLNGQVFAVKLDGDAPAFEDVCVLSDLSLMRHVEDDWSYIVQPGSVAVSGGHLLMAFEDYTAGQENVFLMDADLATGKVTRANIDFVRGVSAYKDGKAVVSTIDWNTFYDYNTNEGKPGDLYVYDPATGEAQLSGQIPYNTVRQFTYAPDLDALMYCYNNRVMGTTDLQNYTQYSYLPADYVRSMQVIGNSMAASSGNQLMLRTISADFRTDQSLTVYGGYNDDGVKLFFERYPQVPVYGMDESYNTMEKLSQAMVSGDNSMDVLQLNIAYENFSGLLNKGYCADLSGNETIAAYVNSLHPVFRDAVMKDGQICAVPLYAYSYDGWYASRSVMNDMGLTEADLPTNIVDLCAFISRWDSEWTEEYAQYAPLEYTADIKRALFSMVMDNYMNQCVGEGREIDLNDPELLTALRAVDGMHTENLTRAMEVTNEEDSDYKQGLFMPNYTLVGDFTSNDSEYRAFIPMTMTANTPFRTGATMEVAFINPRTTHMDAAQDLLACKIDALDSYARHVLVAGETEPVENEYYEEWVRNEENYIADLKKQMEKAEPDEVKDYQEMLAWEESYLEQMRVSERYRISPEKIEWYQDFVLPAVYVLQMNPFTSDEEGGSELVGLLERYMDGQISLEQYLRDAGGKLKMMQLENQ